MRAGPRTTSCWGRTRSPRGRRSTGSGSSSDSSTGRWSPTTSTPAASTTGHGTCASGRGSVRQRVPFILAGNGPRSIRFAARTGEAWATTGSPAETIDEWFTTIGRYVEILDEELARHPGRRIDRYLHLDAAPRNSLESMDLFDEMVGRAAELGFTDVIACWPRDDEPYRASTDVLEAIAERGLSPGA